MPFATTADSSLDIAPAIGNRLAAVLSERGIDIEAAERTGIYSAFRDKHGLTPAPDGDHIVFPYVRDGETTGIKARNLETRRWSQSKGGNKTLWLRDMARGCKRIVITEGEWDALAALSAGITGVVSIPEGAPAETGQKAYPALDDAADLIAEAESVVLATDNDKPGAALFEDLCQVIGKAKCCFVEYPKGCKDLNDVLLQHGEEAVARVVDDAKPVPVSGVYSPRDMPRLGPLNVYRTGISPDFDEHIGLCRKQVSVWTGYANTGKSSLIKNVITALAKRHSVNIGVAAFEDDIFRYYEDDVAGIWAGYPRSSFRGDDDVRFREFYEDRFAFVSNDETGETVTLEWLYERIQTMIVRYRSEFILVDPWTEITAPNGETDFRHIERGLNMFNQMARAFNVHIMIVAHPKKPPEIGKLRPPRGYDISGAAHWANKPYNGITLHPVAGLTNIAEIIVWKTKRREMGRNGSFYLRYIPSSGLMEHIARNEVERMLAEVADD